VDREQKHVISHVISSILQPLHRPIYAKRQAVLTRIISEHLQPSDKVLDVGCGSGALGASLREAGRSRDVTVEGLEKYPRGGEPIRVFEYPGSEFPFADASYDVVILADVLHHEQDPENLLREAVRVSQRLVIVKDHQIAGPLALPRVSLIDWAANAPYGVQCLYRYNTPAQWSDTISRLKLKTVRRFDSLDLYPPVVNFLFGRRLQFMLIAAVSETA
jgi:ubiquinone/menaquinone biosynthesis C-methylase UbiE